MKIIIKDFYALKNVEFEIQKGISVIAGKNGSGKSQILMRLANKTKKDSMANYLNDYYGYPNDYPNNEQIEVSPEPEKTDYRPAIRSIATENRGQGFGLQKPLESYYTSNFNSVALFESKYTDFFSLITNLKIAGTVEERKQSDKDNWVLITTKFEEVFCKTLKAKSTIQGTQIGIEIDGKITKFSNLSTGELEFLSLLSELVIYKNEIVDNHLILIDELDSHFHPDLQSKIINAISELCKEKYVLITTHSPSVMLSVPPEKLFYLEKFQDCVNEKNPKEYKNQIVNVADDSKVFEKIGELYKGFSTDFRLVEHFSRAFNREVFHYAYECMKEPDVLQGTDGRESDSQISTIRDSILMLDDPVIAEIGCGRGRTLAMFHSIDPSALSKISYIGIDINNDNLKEIENYAKEIKLSEELKSFSIDQNVLTESVNFTIFANVIHEIPSEILCDELTKYIKYSKKNGKIIIVECMELPVGEKQFVVFYYSSLLLLLNTNIKDSVISIRATSPKTHSGIPLMNALLTINKPSEVSILKEDLKLAINDIIKTEATALKNHYSGTALLSSTSFAFRTHNLANAYLALSNIVNI